MVKNEHFWRSRTLNGKNLFQTDRQTHRQTDRHTHTNGRRDRQTERHTETEWHSGSIGRASASRSNGFHDRGSNPVRSIKTNCESFSESKMLSRLVVGVPMHPRVYTHAQEWLRTHVKDSVVHVRVRWITERRKTQHALVWLGRAALAPALSAVRMAPNQSINILFLRLFTPRWY